MLKTKNSAFSSAKLVCFLILIICRSSHGQEYFNPAALELDQLQQTDVNLSIFETGDQAPGNYQVDIFINNQQVDTRIISFELSQKIDGRTTLQPCLNKELLSLYGVKTADYWSSELADNDCVDLNVIPQSSTNFDFNNQQLLLSIPQVALIAPVFDYIAPALLDEGIPAGILNYNFSGANIKSRSNLMNSQNNQYISLRPGLNIGAWRLRNYSTWNKQGESGQAEWNSVYSYLQRDIISLKSQFVAGESYSPADIFDSVSFRGVQIASDDDMLPDSLRGYAPVVQGIARTNAEITIRQNGYIIYQNYVASGAFQITNLYSTGGSGDLNVTVKEADGSEQNFVVPYASLPILQREGRLKYSLTGGQYRSYNSDIQKNQFLQGTMIYGLPWELSLYGGVQHSDKYQSVATGIGKNFGFIGAVSTDLIQSTATLQGSDNETKGQSLRIRYSKNFWQTGTNLSIAGYRSSTSGYYSLNEALDSYSSRDYEIQMERRRNRTELTLNQNISQSFGVLSLRLVDENYWDSDKNMRSYGLGYNNSWNGINYNIHYTDNRHSFKNETPGGKNTYSEQNIMFNFNVPLDNWFKNTYASYGFSHNNSGNTTHTVGLNGTALSDNRLNWNLQEGYSSDNQGNNGNLSANYRGSYGEMLGGYGYDDNFHRFNYGVAGGVILHPDGITFSQSLGETVVLVKAPGASNVDIHNQVGVKTDFRGYTAVPYVNPYRRNEITLNTETLADDVELTLMSQTVIPTRGAVVLASYDTQIGARALVTLLRPDNTSVPFGATVTLSDASSGRSFIVGEQSQVYITGLKNKGSFNVQWGPGQNDQCRTDYQLPEQPTPAVSTQNMSSVILIATLCQ